MKSISQSISMIMLIVAVCLSFTSSVSAQSISVNESLNITIKGVLAAEHGRINGVYNVDSNGYVYMPLIEKVKASGKTVSSLARSIEAAYKAAGIYKGPRIAVISNQDDNNKIIREKEVVTIGGYVKSPGQRPYIVGMTLFQAISAAGGETAFGSIRRVELDHKGRKKIYDMRNASHGRIRVYPGDTINVPQKDWKGH